MPGMPRKNLPILPTSLEAISRLQTRAKLSVADLRADLERALTAYNTRLGVIRELALSVVREEDARPEAAGLLGAVTYAEPVDVPTVLDYLVGTVGIVDTNTVAWRGRVQKSELDEQRAAAGDLAAGVQRALNGEPPEREERTPGVPFSRRRGYSE